MIDPYQTPQTKPKKQLPVRRTLFDQCTRLLMWGISGGVVMGLVGVILMSHNIALGSTLLLIARLGVLISIGSILPMSIWGIVLGYREGQKK